MKNNWIVVGGGMRGIAAAVYLRRSGKEVTLIEGADLPGGIMCPMEWDGLYVDRGCHLFDNGHGTSAQFYRDIMGDDVLPIDVKYASVNRGVKSNGIAVPDMSQFPEEEQRLAEQEVVASAAQADTGAANTMIEFYEKRFGPTVSSYLRDCAKKFCSYDVEQLDVQAAITLPLFARIRIGSDDRMLQLKQEPALDDRLAAASPADRMHYYHEQSAAEHRNTYPAEQGMLGWCLAANAYMQQIGVNVLTKTKLQRLEKTSADTVSAVLADDKRIEAGNCFWALPSSLYAKMHGVDDPTKGLAFPVSFMIYHFRIKPEQVGPYTYIHDYSLDSTCFRMSCPGVYGQQLDADGYTYVSAEVTTHPGSDNWERAKELPAKLWGEMQKQGLVDASAPMGRLCLDKVPVAIMLPGIGWSQAKAALNDSLKAVAGNVVFSDGKPLGKSDIMDALYEDLQGYI